MSLSDAFELAVLDQILGGATTLLGATVYIGLSSTTPTDAGANFTEPVGNGYARVAVSNNLTQWPAASGSSPATKSNANDVTFPANTGSNWGTMTHFGVFTAASGGTAQITGALDTPRLVAVGDTFRFPATLLKVTMD